MSDSTWTSDASSACEAGGTGLTLPLCLALCIAWYPEQTDRAGEVCIVPPVRGGAAFVLGRGPSSESDPHRRLDFARQRAHLFDPVGPLGAARISRVQIVVEPRGTQGLAVRNVGRSPLWHNGARCTEAFVVPGDTLRFGQDLVLVCVRRHVSGRAHAAASMAAPFGHPDADGFIGESPQAWELRRSIAFVAEASDHVLVVGESGSGKELVARAIHARSSRAAAPLVARNAATFPEGLIDSELFGHARSYPNAGMPERVGLLGQAAGGTLFLDEIAELPASLQTHLLRVLDHGEYQRLGESTPRSANVRFIAATNRPDGLRPDLAARFKLVARVPSLRDRLEDVPLLVAGRLRALARSQTRGVEPFLGADGAPRLSCVLVERLVRHGYTTNVRELDAIVWDAIASSEGDTLQWPPARPVAEVATEAKPAEGTEASGFVDPRDVDAVAVAKALADHDGNLERTWRALGLSSRHVLTRLMTKYAIRRSKAS